MRIAQVTHVLALTLVALALACGDDGNWPHSMLWDPGSGGLYAFPDDAWTVADSSARTGLRPNVDPDRIAALDDLPETYRDIFRDLSTLDGFGLTAGMMLRFDTPLDAESLWSGDETADPSAPIAMMVEIGDDLVAWPYELSLTDEDQTVILEPMKPLPPESRGFLAVTRRVSSADGSALERSPAMEAALRGDSDDPYAARVAARVAEAAQDFVALGGVASVDELLGVVVFTTQSVYQDSLAIAADIAARDIRPKGAIECVTEALWRRCEGQFTAVDYRGADAFIDEIDGPDEVDASQQYDLYFTAYLPLERPGPYGGSAFPVLIYGHGLGSGQTQAAKLAEYAAPWGMATIAIDALCHGAHPTATMHSTVGRAMDFFGIDPSDLSFEPLAMREHFRQSTYDKLQLVRMLRLGLDLDGDGVVDLDPDRIGYLGVSLGGIMGPELLALAPEIDPAVLVVPGGRVSSIIRDAEQFSIVIDFMKPEDATDGDVARFFPVLQTILDRGDPAVWATHLLDAADAKPAGFPTSTPHLLMAMVIDDDTVPNTANRFLARSLGIPVVPPLRQEVGLVGMTHAAPVAANLPDGRTAGLLQLDRIPDGEGGTKPATHSNVGDSEVGVEAWFHFLDTYLGDGTPEIIDPYEVLGIP